MYVCTYVNSYTMPCGAFFFFFSLFVFDSKTRGAVGDRYQLSGNYIPSQPFFLPRGSCEVVAERENCR